jgi:hypothetical protein
LSWRNCGTGDLTTHGFQPSFPASVFWRLGAALRRQRGGDDRLVRVDVGNGRDADARRLDDVDGVDADARTDVARRRGVVPWHVGRDDGGDDAAVLGSRIDLSLWPFSPPAIPGGVSDEVQVLDRVVGHQEPALVLKVAAG